jgi:XapX domain-containing protein
MSCARGGARPAPPVGPSCGRSNRESVMTGYLVSLFMGLAVGAAYGLVHVRSPAPPMIALVGLFGMILGQQAVDMAKRRFVPPAQTSMQRSLLF